MKRKALRRQQQERARARHIRIVWRSYGPWPWERSPFNSLPERWRWWRYRATPWKQVSRCTMNGEPKSWQKAFNLRPSRGRQNQALRAILRGVDPDTVKRWPDYRRPHIYYW